MAEWISARNKCSQCQRIFISNAIQHFWNIRGFLVFYNIEWSTFIFPSPKYKYKRGKWYFPTYFHVYLMWRNIPQLLFVSCRNLAILFDLIFRVNIINMLCNDLTTNQIEGENINVISLLCRIISLFIEKFSLVLIIIIDIYTKYCHEKHPKTCLNVSKVQCPFFSA